MIKFYTGGDISLDLQLESNLMVMLKFPTVLSEGIPPKTKILHTVTKFVRKKIGRTQCGGPVLSRALSVFQITPNKWASLRENLSSEVCEQQRRRPACASAQSDQRLCYSRFGKNHILACYRRTFNFLASLCSCGDWFECGFVRNPEDRFSHDEAQMLC